MKQQQMVLFHMMGCPYCAKVRSFIESNGLKDRITYRDVEEDSGAAGELEDLTGDDQVPCLVINGEPVLESDDIIERLRPLVKQSAA